MGLWHEVFWVVRFFESLSSQMPLPTWCPLCLPCHLSTLFKPIVEQLGAERCGRQLCMHIYLRLNEWVAVVHVFPGHNLNSQKLWNPHLHFHEVLWCGSQTHNIMGGEGCTTTSETSKRYSWYSPPLLRLMKRVTPSIGSMDCSMAAFIRSGVIKQIKTWF